MYLRNVAGILFHYWDNKAILFFLFSVIKRYAHDYHAPAVQSTYNDLPQPQGSWKVHYQAAQRRYNTQLIFGIGFFVATLIIGKSAGFLEFYDDIPKTPAKIDSYK